MSIAEAREVLSKACWDAQALDEEALDRFISEVCAEMRCSICDQAPVNTRESVERALEEHDFAERTGVLEP